MMKPKKIFLDIGHPAHVHYFKHLIQEMQEKGHRFIITARDKEMAHILLQKEGLKYTSRGKGEDRLMGKLIYTIKADRQLYKIAKKEKPDLFLSFASPYTAHIAFLMRKPHITIDDTETARIGQAMYRPFSDVILTPDSFLRDFGKKHVRFPSFIELSYLHPNRFKPDPDIYDELGLKQRDPYVIMRFVAWTANHDIGQKGLSLENKIRAVNEFSKYAQVFISSEKNLPRELESYRLSISPERIHHAIAYSSLMYGESGTMTSESAILGTPAIFINNLKDSLGTIKEQSEKYGLVFSYTDSISDQNKSINKGVEILQSLPGKWAQKQKILLKDKIDCTEILEGFISNYPDSVKP